MVCDQCKADVQKLNYENSSRNFLCKKCTHQTYTPYQFKPFFDQSLGIHITSYSHKKEIEKTQGVTYMSNDERMAATKEAKRNISERKDRHVRHGMENIMTNVQRGYSYIEQAKREGLC